MGEPEVVDASGGAGEQPSTKYRALLAAAPHFGWECMDHNRAFAKCKLNDPNPDKCLAEGRKVTGCVLKVLRTCEDKCADSFTKYQDCLHWGNRRLEKCRDEQEAFDACLSKHTITAQP